MRNFLPPLLVVGLMLLAGCAVNPRVTMSEVSSHEQVVANQNSLVTNFYLQANRLDIAFRETRAAAPAAAAASTPNPAARPPRSGEGAARPTAAVATTPAAARPHELAVVNTPIEATGRRFMLQTNSDLMSRTQLVVTKRENTDLIQSIGSEVIDNRTALIQNVASVARLGIGLLVSGEGERRAGYELRWSSTEGDRDSGFRPEPADPNYPGREIWRHDSQAGLAITVQAPPSTAAPYSASLFRRGMSGIYHAACRRVLVEHTVSNTEFYRWEGVVADPAWLEFTPLPRKGRIDFHAQCGTSVRQEGDTTATPDALLNTAVTQAVAVVTAIEQARKDEE